MTYLLLFCLASFLPQLPFTDVEASNWKSGHFHCTAGRGFEVLIHPSETHHPALERVVIITAPCTPGCLQTALNKLSTDVEGSLVITHTDNDAVVLWDQGRALGRIHVEGDRFWSVTYHQTTTLTAEEKSTWLTFLQKIPPSGPSCNEESMTMAIAPDLFSLANFF